ncbi:hypothetical protein [Cryobacterium sp. Hh38]|uniref:hypothetical protein n=1 Tax=Cryobacterium sp. Hh38 TaxID=1259156 RepID=UPI00106CD143|nr:hypothetical protein [Cryobacterium sp. Hh38]TFD57899.1 hypothetical protein E3T41_12695 [Cryobacterium sp. Hh38]
MSSADPPVIPAEVAKSAPRRSIVALIAFWFWIAGALTIFISTAVGFAQPIRTGSEFMFIVGPLLLYAIYVPILTIGAAVAVVAIAMKNRPKRLAIVALVLNVVSVLPALLVILLMMGGIPVSAN